MIKKLRMRFRRKSFLKFYEQLEEPIRTQAINNFGSLNLVKKAPNLSYALMFGFAWDKSNEGIKYWREVYYNIIDKNKSKVK